MRACTMQFMKHVFPKLRRPRRPKKNFFNNTKGQMCFKGNFKVTEE